MVFSAEAKRVSQPKGAAGKERCSPRSLQGRRTGARQEGCRWQAPQRGERACWDAFPPGAASLVPALNRGRVCLPGQAVSVLPPQCPQVGNCCPQSRLLNATGS